MAGVRMGFGFYDDRLPWSFWRVKYFLKGGELVVLVPVQFFEDGFPLLGGLHPLVVVGIVQCEFLFAGECRQVGSDAVFALGGDARGEDGRAEGVKLFRLLRGGGLFFPAVGEEEADAEQQGPCFHGCQSSRGAPCRTRVKGTGSVTSPSQGRAWL